MKQLSHFINEAKATYCGRCDTTHVPPSKGGTCPALKEGEDMPWEEDPKNPTRKVGERKDQYGNPIKNVAKHLAKKAIQTNEEADKGIRLAKVMHKGKHVANVITYRGRSGVWVSGAETPDGQNATKKYGIGMMDTKKEIMKKIKQHHMTEEAEQIDELSKKTLGSYVKKASGHAAGSAATIAAIAASSVGKAPEKTKRGLRNRLKGISMATDKLTKEEVEELDEVSAAKLRDYTDKASDARGHRNLSTAKLDKRYKSMALAHEKIRQRHAMVPATEEKMKTLSQFINEATMNEAHDVELKPHSNGTHYIVHKIHPSSGIEKDQLKVGEKISDTHVDDLHDMGYSVKIHKK